MAFDREGKRFAGKPSSANNRLIIFDAVSNADLSVLPQSFYGLAAAWHPDGRYLATADLTPSRLYFTLWDALNGTVVRKLEGHRRLA